jgi:hypothetical protein
MSRKHGLLLAPLALAALAATGVALAAGGPNAQSASATFTATTVSHARLTTCTVNGSDTFASTLATYAGAATSSDARLNGTITIRAASLVDTDTGVGRVVGVWRIRSTTNGVGAHGSINAVVGNGDATGAAIGRVNGPAGQLAATLSSPFDPATGFGSSSDGKLGTGTAAGAGVVLNGPFCREWHKHPLRWLHRHIRRHHG